MSIKLRNLLNCCNCWIISNLLRMLTLPIRILFDICLSVSLSSMPSLLIQLSILLYDWINFNMYSLQHWLFHARWQLHLVSLWNQNCWWKLDSGQLLLQLHKLKLLPQLCRWILSIQWQLFCLLNRMFSVHQRFCLRTLCFRILPKWFVLLELLKHQRLSILFKSYCLHCLSPALLFVGPRLSVLPSLVRNLHFTTPMLLLSSPILPQLQPSMHPLSRAL